MPPVFEEADAPPFPELPLAPETPDVPAVTPGCAFAVASSDPQPEANPTLAKASANNLIVVPRCRAMRNLRKHAKQGASGRSWGRWHEIMMPRTKIRTT